MPAIFFSPSCLGLIRDWLFLEKSNMLFKPPWVLKRPFSPVSTTHNYSPNSGSPISQESKDPKRHSLIFCPNIIQARATKEHFCRIRWFTDFKLCAYFLKFLIHLPRSCLHIPPPFIRTEALCKGHGPLLLRFQEFLLHLHILLIPHTVDFALFGNSLAIVLQTSCSTPGFSLILSSALAFLRHCLPTTYLNFKQSKLSPLLIFHMLSPSLLHMALWATSTSVFKPVELGHVNALDPSPNKTIPFCACFLLPTQHPSLSQ